MDDGVMNADSWHFTVHGFIAPPLDIGLDGKALAEAARIKIEGENPWMTVIQNASLQSKSEHKD